MPGLRLVNQKSVVGGPSGPARAVPVRSAEEDCQAARREPLMEA